MDLDINIIFIVLKGYISNFKVYKDIKVIFKVYKDMNVKIPFFFVCLIRK